MGQKAKILKEEFENGYQEKSCEEKKEKVVDRGAKSPQFFLQGKMVYDGCSPEHPFLLLRHKSSAGAVKLAQ
jgi:hypothetical protein